jgi:hypothetical protein
VKFTPCPPQVQPKRRQSQQLIRRPSGEKFSPTRVAPNYDSLPLSLCLRIFQQSAGRWLDKLAERLIRLKEAIVTELRKYSDVHVPRSVHDARGKGGGRFQASYTAGIEQQRQGAVHLQAVADQLLTVADLLSGFRCDADR